MNSNSIKIASTLVAILLLAGCATQKTVTIRSNPPGATVFVDGKDAGISPLTTPLSFDSKTKVYNVTARKEGFKDGINTIAYEPKSETDYTIILEKIEAVPIELVSVEPAPTDKGVKLVVVRKSTLAYLEVIERSPNVASVTRVTPNEDKAVQIGHPVLSPSEDVVIYGEFVQEEKGGTYSNIQKQRVGSFAKTRLTYGKYRDLFPAFTPDGTRLVFSSTRSSSNPTLWLVNVNSPVGITKLTNTQAEDYAPCVSPDDQLIVFTSNPPDAEEAQIWTVPMGSSLMTQLREGESPQVSPDGKQILFVRRDKITKKRQLWLMSIDGAQETQLTQNTEYETIEPRWSPDGKWIVYASDEGRDSQQRSNFDIWIMASDGSKRTQMTTNGSWDDGPCFDRKGENVYFRSNRGGAWNIWRFQPLLPK
jgi:WD40 repeat protein